MNGLRWWWWWWFSLHFIFYLVLWFSFKFINYYLLLLGNYLIVIVVLLLQIYPSESNNFHCRLPVSHIPSITWCCITCRDVNLIHYIHLLCLLSGATEIAMCFIPVPFQFSNDLWLSILTRTTIIRIVVRTQRFQFFWHNADNLSKSFEVYG